MDAPILARFVIPRRPLSKKNHRPIFRNARTGRSFLGKSPELRAYEAHCISHLSLTWRRRGALTCRLWVESHAYFENRVGEPDLLGWQETLWDCLEAAGVIANDKQVESSDGSRKHLRRGVEPSATIVVREFIE